MKKLSTLLLYFALLISPIFASEVEMADALRSDGKIYVVVIVLAIITLGLFGYLFHLDKKVSEKEKSLPK